MARSIWWQEQDGLPTLPSIEGFRVEPSTDVYLLTRLAELEPAEVSQRLDEGHLPYLAYLDKTPTAYGWVARHKAMIGELNLAFSLSPHNRYLWDFQTLSQWRGRGIYPHLLQAILRTERLSGGTHFWIISAPENIASSAGIARAGFTRVGKILFLAQNEAALLPFDKVTHERASVGTALLGLELLESNFQPVAECWHCVITSPLGCQCQQTRESDLATCGTLCNCVKD